MYHLCQYEDDTSSANCKHNNINTDALVQTTATVEYIQGGQKRLFLRDENFVTFTGNKVCDMYRVSKFCLEKCIPIKGDTVAENWAKNKKGK